MSEKMTPFEHALENIKKFVEDCEVPMKLLDLDGKDEKYYYFQISPKENKYMTYKVGMPGIPLKKSWYKPNDFALKRGTIYITVDGLEYFWSLGLVTKVQYKEDLERNLKELTEKSEIIKKEMNDIHERKRVFETSLSQQFD